MTENVSNFDVKVNDGSTGQAEAVRMARVMCEVNAENRYLETRRFVNKRSKNG
jgi:ribosomal protein S9